jgi:hypothetical protein
MKRQKRSVPAPKNPQETAVQTGISAKDVIAAIKKGVNENIDRDPLLKKWLLSTSCHRISNGTSPSPILVNPASVY